MNAWPVVSARRFEVFVRWSTYAVVATPLLAALGRLILSGPSVPTAAPAVALASLLVAGNIIVSRWSVDTVVGRHRRLPVGGIVVWLLVLAALITALLLAPLPVTNVAVAAAVGSAAASVVPALDARGTALLNAGLLAIALPLALLIQLPLLFLNALLVSIALWAGWFSVWTLRILRELQSVHEDRAALALANERLRISRELHDVFGRTLATIAIKSELASELVRRDRGEQAADEMAEVRRLAQDAGTEVRRVVRGELQTTWEGELAGARSLLDSAGIRCTIAGDIVSGSAAVALAWVVREGVTNVLRHSSASQVTIATTTGDDEVQLTLANDGIAAVRSTNATPSTGTGLSSMSDRLAAIGGHLQTTRDGDWFLLHAVVPLTEGEHP